jgi:hypothetical protein
VSAPWIDQDSRSDRCVSALGRAILYRVDSLNRPYGSAPLTGGDSRPRPSPPNSPLIRWPNHA